MRKIATKYLKRWIPKGKSVAAIVNGPPRQRLIFDPQEFAAIYAIGDIHGCYDALVAVMSKIEADAARFSGKILIIGLGDYIDRGARSRDVLQFLCEYRQERTTLIALCGNHEQAFVDFIDSPQTLSSWMRFAGVETLRSYGMDIKFLRDHASPEDVQTAIEEKIPQQHRDFLKALPIMVQIGQLIFVHAGLRPSVPLESQSDGDLLWIREPFLKQGPKLPVTVIHGHTPVKDPHFGDGRIGIDTGAYATGRLTVLRIAGPASGILC